MKPAPELSLLESWIAEHSIRIFLLIAGIMLLGAGGILLTLLNQESTQHQVDVLKPQVTKIVRAANTCDANALTHKRASRDCATQMRIALVVCRRHPKCQAAFLATLQLPPRVSRGGGAQNPSNPGQQPGPGPEPGHSGHVHHAAQPKKPPKKHLPKSVPTLPAPAPPELPATPPAPGNSGNTPGGEHGVKACVDVAVSACVKVEVP
jgi:hypothetical protein